MSDFSDAFKNRTKQLAISIIKLSRSFPKTEEAFIIKKQILRSSFSVASNYRAVCRARSDKEFVAKMNIVLEEADETLFWLEIIKEKDWNDKSELEMILKEGNELTAIFVSSLKTVNSRLNNKN